MDEILDRARDYEYHRDWDKAIEEYNLAIQLDANAALAWIRRGAARAHKKEQVPDAFKDFSQGLKLAPRHREAFLSRGKVHVQLGDYDKAINDFTAALATDPTDFATILLRADARTRYRDFYGALDDYAAVLEYNPRCREALVQRTFIYEAVGEVPLALADCDTLMAWDPNDTTYEGIFMRARIFQRANDYPSAIKEYTRIIATATEQDSIDAVYSRALMYLLSPQRSVDRALEDLSLVVTLDPQHGDAWFERAKLQADGFLYSQALASFAMAIPLSNRERRGECHVARANMIIERQGRPAEAIEDLDKAIEIYEDNAELYTKRGNMKALINDTAGASSDFSKSLELNPKQPDLWLKFGRTKLDAGDLDGCINDMSQAITYDPEAAEAYLERGRCYQKQGNFTLAFRDFKAASTLDERHLDVFSEAAMMINQASMDDMAAIGGVKTSRVPPEMPAYSSPKAKSPPRKSWRP